MKGKSVKDEGLRGLQHGKSNLTKQYLPRRVPFTSVHPVQELQQTLIFLSI